MQNIVLVTLVNNIWSICSHISQQYTNICSFAIISSNPFKKINQSLKWVFTSNVKKSASAEAPMCWYQILPSSMSLCKKRNILADIFPSPMSSQPRPGPSFGCCTIIVNWPTNLIPQGVFFMCARKNSFSSTDKTYRYFFLALLTWRKRIDLYR